MLRRENPLLYLITSGAATDESFPHASEQILNLIGFAVSERVSLIQIREKHLSAKNLFRLVQRAALLTRNSDTILLVNDRADIALAAGADGVHLTSNSIPPKFIRQNFPPDFFIGVSCHALTEVLRAKADGADFATFSPIFPTPSKEKYGAPQGLEKLREVCREAKEFPVVALGGIDEYNFKETLEAGASGIAAIRLLNDVERLSGFAGKIREYQARG